jgi:Spy/CpxP family protein refolding chaperone
MKASKITAIAIILLLIAGSAFAQKSGANPGRKGEIVKQYRTLELLKVLDLSETESKEVLPILKAIDKNRETFQFQRQQAINEIEFALKHNEPEAKITGLNNKLMKLQKEFETERTKLYERLRSQLTEEQFAKFIVFNCSFEKRLRERLQKIHKKYPNKH